MFSLLRQKKITNNQQNQFKNRTLPTTDTRLLTQNFLTLLNYKNQHKKFNPKQSATITTAKSNKRNHSRHESVMQKQNSNNNYHKRNVSNYTKAQQLNEPEYLFTKTPVQVPENKHKATNSTSTIKNIKKRQSNKKIGAQNIVQTIVKTKNDSNLACQQQVIVKQKNIISDQFFDLKFSTKQQDLIQINPYYYQNHKSITSNVRAILLDWMMQISQQYGLLRYTYYYAKNIIQIYLSKLANIKKSRLQLIAVTSLFLASKLQQYEPRSTQDYSLATNHGYSATQIESMESQICQTLRWKLKSITHAFWVDIFIAKWTIYRDKAGSNQLDFHAKAPNYVLELYDSLFQILDVAILDIQSLQYKARTIVASLLMLVLGYQHGQFSMDQIQYSFPFSSKYLFSMNSSLMVHYNRFLKTIFDIDNLELLPSIQFISSYFFVNGSRTNVMQRDRQSHNRNGLVQVQKRGEFIKESQGNYYRG